MKTPNLFANIPLHNPDKECFECLINTDSIMIERIISKGHKSTQSDGWLAQERNEWIVVLKGRARILFEDKVSIQLDEEDYLNIPSHKKHKVEWTDPDIETIWLAVHYQAKENTMNTTEERNDTFATQSNLLF